MNRFQIIEGDALEQLRRLPVESFDSMVTDPPAGISFMGKTWDHDHGGRAAWCAAFAGIFTEALRVLKPGAHALVWAIPRTSHWTATALEDAGFEIRDIVVHLFGTGFPKSLDVSKAIDKAARRDYVLAAVGLGLEIPGNSLHDWTKAEHSPSDVWWEKFKAALPDEDWRRIEREVVGKRTTGIGAGAGPAPIIRDVENRDITVPATEAACQWEGWGTALKPAAEHWILCRKPLIGTVASNVIEHGTGALNVDGCRVGFDGEEPPSEKRRQYAYETNPEKAHESQGRGKIRHRGDPAKRAASRPGESVGRWPANVVLSHDSRCVLVGEKRVEGSNFGGHPGGRQDSVFGEDHRARPAAGYADADGLETVPSYECVESCPVRMLDEQSGELSSGGTPPSCPRDKTRFAYGAFGGQENPSGIGGSSGTASRFFYCAKPSTAERDIGGVDNRHPTVKAAELMQYFCRLITPPGGVVLDPFMGSGSTGIAALREGFDFVGIEQDAEHCETACHRIKGDAPLFNEKADVIERSACAAS